ncbi:hypothetical protein HK405_009132 [Cladochytrium tenue]|nr:hypothetical protein HK405_009132 [Cladochytrium tenue]
MLPFSTIVTLALAAAAATTAQSVYADVPACTLGFQYPSYRDAGSGFPGCPLAPPSWLPANCYGSNPDDTDCKAAGYHLTGTLATDPCMPTSGLITDAGGYQRLGNELVYLKSATDWCLVFPNQQDPWLQMVYYEQGNVPQTVQGEGLIVAQCQGGYTSSGNGLSAQTVPTNGVLSAYLTINFATPGIRYIQMHGLFDPSVMGVQPADVDTGGQYDSSDFVSCGKEPYSGVDPIMSGTTSPFASSAGSSPFKFTNYVQYTGRGEYCIRICEGLSYGTLDEAPCTAQGIETFPSAGTFVTDLGNGTVSSTTVSISSSTKSSSSTSASSSVTSSGSSGSLTSSASTSTSTSKSLTGAAAGLNAARGHPAVVVGLAVLLAGVLLL